MFESLKIIFKHFELRKIFKYIKNFHWYYSRFKYAKNVKALQNHWNTQYGVTSVENLSFVFSCNDYTIPNDMLRTQKVYSHDEMIFFIEMAEKHYGITKDTKKIFFDIGANIGTTAIYMEKCVLPHAPIIAFEPSKVNCLLLEVNKTINRCSRIKAENYALSNKSSKCRFVYDSESPAGSQIVLNLDETKKYSSKRFQIEEVSTITLDNYIENNNIKPKEIGFLWIDVEGFEPFVLQGGEKLLANKIPLYLEFSPNKLKNNDGFEVLFKLLSRTYNHIFSLKDGEYEIDYLKKLYDEYQEMDTHFDFFFY